MRVYSIQLHIILIMLLEIETLACVGITEWYYNHDAVIMTYPPWYQTCAKFQHMKNETTFWALKMLFGSTQKICMLVGPGEILISVLCVNESLTNKSQYKCTNRGLSWILASNYCIVWISCRVHLCLSLLCWPPMKNLHICAWVVSLSLNPLTLNALTPTHWHRHDSHTLTPVIIWEMLFRR